MPTLYRQIPKRVIFLLFFSGFLSWFYWGHSWYPEARLFVTGTVADPSSQVSLYWDSGHGFNGYEKERYSLQGFNGQQETAGIPVRITRSATSNPASNGHDVVLGGIAVDSRPFALLAESLGNGLRGESGKILFEKDGATLSLRLYPKSHLRLAFPVYNRAGKVVIQRGGAQDLYDLYAPNDQGQWAGRSAKVIDTWFVDKRGRFTVSMAMPRYPLEVLRVVGSGEFSIAALWVETADGIRIDATSRVLGPQIVDYPMGDVDRSLKRHYHRERLFFQIIFALLCSALLLGLFSYGARFAGLRDIIVGEQRLLFWVMLGSSCLLYSLWQISFWPGVLSNDSLEIWRASQIPGMYLGDHPPLNVVFYLFLNQLWNNPAVVPLVQNFLSSLLVAHIFFSLYRRGLPLICLLPSYVLVALSLPVGLYSIILWKDVPYALLVVLLGFRLSVSFFDKRCGGKRISWKDACVLFVLTLLLAGFRHNGVLYVVLVPCIIVALGLVRIRPRLMILILGMGIICGALFFFGSGKPGAGTYLASRTKVYLSQAMERLSPGYLRESGVKYLGIFDVNQKKMQWDLVHLCMYGRYTNDFLRQLRWNDVYPYLPLPQGSFIKKMNTLAWSLYWKSYQVPWVYFSWNPVYMLFLYPLLPFFLRRMPLTAVFSLYIVIPVAILVFLNIFNWRYYYFAHLASYFIFPMIATDLWGGKKGRDLGAVS